MRHISAVLGDHPPYSTQMVVRAKEHREAGWTLREIQRLLLAEFGITPTHTTIHSWVNPKYAERIRAQGRDRARAKWQRDNPHRPVTRLSKERGLERMRLLRAEGCSYRSIAIVAAVWWGEVVSEETVRYRLQKPSRATS